MNTISKHEAAGTDSGLFNRSGIQDETIIIMTIIKSKDKTLRSQPHPSTVRENKQVLNRRLNTQEVSAVKCIVPSATLYIHRPLDYIG